MLDYFQNFQKLNLSKISRYTVSPYVLNQSNQNLEGLMKITTSID